MPMLRLLLLAILVALPSVARAQLDTTLRATMLRAGPDDAFPAVSRLRNGANLHVFGCVADRSWCDVQYGRRRGFLPRADIRPSPRLDRAPAVDFSVAEYWDAHYQRRPWYPNRDRWLDWGTPGFVPPRP